MKWWENIDFSVSWKNDLILIQSYINLIVFVLHTLKSNIVSCFGIWHSKHYFSSVEIVYSSKLIASHKGGDKEPQMPTK